MVASCPSLGHSHEHVTAGRQWCDGDECEDTVGTGDRGVVPTESVL